MGNVTYYVTCGFRRGTFVIYYMTNVPTETCHIIDDKRAGRGLRQTGPCAGGEPVSPHLDGGVRVPTERGSAEMVSPRFASRAGPGAGRKGGRSGCPKGGEDTNSRAVERAWPRFDGGVRVPKHERRSSRYCAVTGLPSGRGCGYRGSSSARRRRGSGARSRAWGNHARSSRRRRRRRGAGGRRSRGGRGRRVAGDGSWVPGYWVGQPCHLPLCPWPFAG